MKPIPFRVTDWACIDRTQHTGETGVAYWQTLQQDGLRMRVVEYSAGYLADHWCSLGHIVYCLEGVFESELDTGECITLTAGMSYVVSDNMSMHRSSSVGGAKLFIIDGIFLKR